MPPRLPRLAPGRMRLARTDSLLPRTSKCLLCQFNAAPAAAAGKQVPRRRQHQVGTTTISRARRQLSTTAAEEEDVQPKPLTPQQAVAELESALADLEKAAVGYVNLPRLRLAQRGVEQRDGHEVIRVAVIALEGQGKSSAKSRELIRLLLADPLKAEEEWERSLTRTADPVLLRISHRAGGGVGGGFKNRVVKEVEVESAMLRDHYLEVLVIDGDVLVESEEGTAGLAENVLVPNIQIPASFGAHYSPITAPVHKALVVGDGILGAASLLRLPSLEGDLIQTAVDLPSSIHDTEGTTQFSAVDVALGTAALNSFRENVGNALKYEQQWSSSGLPTLRDWVISGSGPSTSPLKPPVHALIRSLLSSTEERIHYREASALSAALSAKVSSATTQSLQRDLDEWAEAAHTELRDQLDQAFSGRRWRALAWWKLFWRVDDVSAITSDILASRFLTGAEQEVIYIAGKIDAAGVLAEPTTPRPSSANWAYKDVAPERDPEEDVPLGIEPTAPEPRVRDVIPVTDSPLDGAIATPAIKAHPWPLHIPLTRAYIASSSIPRLQALAQKLVAQTLGTTAFSGAFAGLIYVSNLSVGVYEAGAVAALGTVWALRRMQGAWEGGRGFWEREVREEGRKASMDK
ncbi:hypothetical protein VE03_03005 [Pseudogymnoascus sp. 23342-1-I1]|nr:hypothetical protein VE03_03005 [Pseudogymnoascus sp. 23342-1-I1]